MAQYDPNKKWTWTPEDKFELSGKDFGLILNTFRAILGKPEAQEILLAQQASNVLEGVLAASVEAGVAKEVIEEIPS
jgi:hypothetical protein